MFFKILFVQAHVDFVLRMFDISVLHASMMVMNVCLSDAYRAEPANTICLDGCVISAHTEPQTDFNSITFDFIKLLNSLRSHLITQTPTARHLTSLQKSQTMLLFN